ncbi:unnamed protein product [Allacma fusca]|uniref:WAP domain-containing protein n=1 Tax=Allacma fusca TaxID=39272 RepID=A0A8J2JHX3_9HEXA|nr:unnamed protein product [Allacma fusca]
MKYAAVFLLVGLFICINVQSATSQKPNCPAIGCPANTCPPGPKKIECTNDKQCQNAGKKACCTLCCGTQCF